MEIVLDLLANYGLPGIMIYLLYFRLEQRVDKQLEIMQQLSDNVLKLTVLQEVLQEVLKEKRG